MTDAKPPTEAELAEDLRIEAAMRSGVLMECANGTVHIRNTYRARIEQLRVALEENARLKEEVERLRKMLRLCFDGECAPGYSGEEP
ncbi:MAG TPA: hypothetical protein DCY13_04860 [Verrucomicrobiales bacterium]|nr:hypothetical protein [Verrucomicrobiales bacterium]